MLNSKSVYIVVLNWNGWEDTIECLESIQQLRQNNYRIVLVDNGSEDDSLNQIKSWASGKISVKSNYVTYHSDNKNMYILEYDQYTAEAGGEGCFENEFSKHPSYKKMVIIKNNENLGFAGGCNVGIRYALASGADYIWLLNNDTIVENKSLSELVKFLKLNADFKCVTGQIRLYDKPTRIWNCGGKLTWYGTRKYYYENYPVSLIPKNGFRRITFVTGCSALFRASVFVEIGLLSDKYFFGEEDYEISHRMKRKGYGIACLYSSIIYHKVGATIGPINKKKLIPRVYIYYINRFINMRNYMPPVAWHIWRIFYSFYIIPMLIVRYKVNLCSAFNIIRKIQRESIKLNKVDKKTFDNYMGLKAD